MFNFQVANQHQMLSYKVPFKITKEAYEKVVYWRRNILEFPKGQYGKEFTREITESINRWRNNAEYRNIAFDAIFVIPKILLQRINIKAKGKENKE